MTGYDAWKTSAPDEEDPIGECIVCSSDIFEGDDCEWTREGYTCAACERMARTCRSCTELVEDASELYYYDGMMMCPKCVAACKADAIDPSEFVSSDEHIPAEYDI